MLIVSEDVRNRRRSHVLAVPLFSRGLPGPTRVSIPAGIGGVQRETMAFCEEIQLLDHAFLEHGPLGAPVPRLFLDRIVTGVRRAIGDVSRIPDAGC